LRTPLTIIRLYGNMLSDGIAGPLAKTQLSYVNKITNASVRLIKLVSDILNISRIELNRIKIDSQPTDPNALIRNCLEELTPVIKAKSATVIFTPRPNLETTALDATLFNEIVHNLVGNALRYGMDNGAEVSIDFCKEKQGYLLKIHDNGLGIPKQDQPHVFERFYRAHNAATADSDGSGLGLYMVKLFTEAAGGKAWFDSTEGKGTTFYIQFPPSGMIPRDSATPQ
jgi:two-component system sensor histidine kinase VicK